MPISDPAVPSLRKRADRRADENPWSDDATTPDLPTLADEPPAAEGLEFGASFPVLAAGYVGTCAAGALFPTAVYFLGLLNDDWSRPFPGANAELILAGLFVGGFFAGAVGAVIFPLIGMVQLFAGMYRQRAITATIAGGWTGFAATLAIAGPTASPPSYPSLLTAMLLGQIGAGWLARRAEHWQNTAGFWPVPQRLEQFRLAQLFGLTAGVAVVAIIVAQLDLSPDAMAAMGIAAAFQTATVGGYLAWKQTRRVGEVPRETTGANVGT